MDSQIVKYADLNEDKVDEKIILTLKSSETYKYSLEIGDAKIDVRGNNIEEIKPGTYKLVVSISKNILMPGTYKLTVASFISRKILYDIVEDKVSVRIEDLGIRKSDLDREGFVVPNYKWEFLQV